MKLRNERQCSKVLVVFARDRETLEEDFVGLALDREQELYVREVVESPELQCLTEEVKLRGWEGGYSENHKPELVYLVFRGGRAQNQGHSDDDFDPEIYGAFVDRQQAEWFAEKDRYIGQKIVPLHVWELKPGWISSNLRWD
ncbi:hypothetical protein [Corynebacterium heidelbergense]|uniref:Uncharacterized protein n=1 Tax=Corynebacterium heidelbergense TaxID=2055947 RepID=A0A364V5T8_9CORY|nr:hypothetical protein [Corynebacterium heidelbergense]RAV32005.1 hypothetical protein DLJ54_05455 [Corynebacterium heidelbergense]